MIPWCSKFALTSSPQTWRIPRHEPAHVPPTQLEMVVAGPHSRCTARHFPEPPEPGVTSGELEFVQRVVDGDTLLLGTGERVRLLGVNTPETVHPKKAVEAFGKEASAFTKRIVEGKLVRLEFDPVANRRTDGKDKYSRTLAYVFLQDGTHLNAEIIRQGYGFAVSSSPPLKYQNEFGRLEREAREQRRGLWGTQ
jgi:micrococcal nuclease